MVGSDEEKVGNLKYVRDVDFLVERTMQPGLYMPVGAIRVVTTDSIRLPRVHARSRLWVASGERGQQPAAGTRAGQPLEDRINKAQVASKTSWRRRDSKG